MSLSILHNGATITDVTPGGTPVYVPGFEMVPAARSDAVQGMPGRMLQVRADGVDIGNDRPAVINIVAEPDRLLVTRGTGEKSNVVTIKRAASAPASPWNSSNEVPTDGWVFSESDYRAVSTLAPTFGFSLSHVRSVQSRSSGKVHAEIVLVHKVVEDYQFSSAEARNFQLGISLEPYTTTTDKRSSGVSYNQIVGSAEVWKEGAQWYSGVHQMVDGDVIAFDFDLDALKVWVKLNGAYVNAGADPATGTNPSMTLAVPGDYFVSAQAGTSATNPPLGGQISHASVWDVRIRTIASQFTESVPAGFSQWAVE